ncbi:hypothetical protein A1F94_010615 [Pyrenophora tritici-repentis]|uniref:Uncharacterized protein n=1 Tax=Pyrenophora tritici-repentis TaxID=45151 RepID=A0A5M9KWW1_9PLEO|nr:hypothetical protein PtrV1_11803 [Pyrenophora tritici-repentis]KAF7444597.1 hypothetical protein A1F99_111500 [Pyrenophora tritici-repentis]KAF7564744.1 hypothetical protein PtrM4_041780 [Pyrenophora tritici-repentis]KAG9378846.1 hypothetical protein A1F94_010615 [Pyrenophora tritici-repentis]KAI0578462.1 hypothetical protein Alg215_06344 [Pyrenophora tritici-repentis]
MVVISNMPMCFSDAKHLGGDEVEYYCKKFGAGTSLA